MLAFVLRLTDRSAADCKNAGVAFEGGWRCTPHPQAGVAATSRRIAKPPAAPATTERSLTGSVRYLHSSQVLMKPDAKLGCLLVIVMPPVVDEAVGQSGAAARNRIERSQSTPSLRQAYPQGSGSATQGSAMQGSVSQGSASPSAGARATGELSMRGFCPVSLAETKQWAPGDPRFTVVYDGKVYRFPDARRLQIFSADPVRYAPALGGDCVVSFAKAGQRTQGDLGSGVRQGGRIYFLRGAQEREAFLANPSAFADADLVLGGECVVTRVDTNQQRPGSPQLTLIHNGLRYRFAGLNQRRAFMASPTRYTAETPATPQRGSAPRTLDEGIESGAGASGSR